MEPIKIVSCISGGNFPSWKNKKKTCSGKISYILGNETF